MLPVGGQWLAVGAEDLADVGGVALAGVEVDVVGDLNRQVHRDFRERDQVRLDPVPVRRVGQDLCEPGASGCPGRATQRQELVQARLRPADARLHADELGGRSGVQHELADPDADPPQVRVVGGEDPVGQCCQPERVVGREVEPGLRR